MGQCNSNDYDVSVKTGDKKGSGTDGNVYIALTDEDGKRSSDFKLDKILKDDFELGHTDTFSVGNSSGLKHITQLYIWRDKTDDNDTWYVEKIVVERCKDKDQTIFPIHRWVPAGFSIKLKEYDSLLPQHDTEQLEQRKRELEAKQIEYQFKVNLEGGPAQIKDIPVDEMFTKEYEWNLMAALGKAKLSSEVLDLIVGEFECLDDLKNIYGALFRIPDGMHTWKDDEAFGAQKLKGCNPAVIRLCQQIPDNFSVTPEMVEPFLEGQTLKECLDTKKIYIIDYKMLDDITKTDDRYLCAPLGLFYVNSRGKLLPIAIQLEQTPSENNPVFLPSDPEYTWLLAKMWFNNADCNYHQSVAHFGTTHILMEYVCIVTNRQLSPSHPLYRLLSNHFLYVIGINTSGLTRLLAPEAWVDRNMTIGRAGFITILSRAWPKWRLNVEGTLPNDLQDRGVDDENALPNYHYRDDAMLLYRAIEKYIRSVLTGIYDSPEKLVDDYEVHNWLQELRSPPEGPGLNGLPEKLTSVDDICAIVTPLVFQASVQHAAVNYSQYEEYAYPPNFPTYLEGLPPRDKEVRKEQDIMNSLISKSRTLEIALIATYLSTTGLNPLGHFEVQYNHDPMSVKALESFRKELAEIEEEMKEKNKTRDHKYSLLLPSIVPNSISM
ncbi:unnamed protein product [Owenia fusiformis]|uniref:Uncharacterized protein n=1 Tax=Owenia fusiformis TaxID=6347 RepID=A0A8J1U1I8_OWEFU|nr:unnamed protein product [Owenia fusiformis]